VIALYSLNSTQSTTMTIDGSDNLFVEGNSGYMTYVEYPYGSTTVAKTYSMGGYVNGNIAGISVRGNRLFLASFTLNPSESATLFECPLDGSGKCVQKVTVNDYGCGYTTTRRFSVYNFYNQGAVKYHPFDAWRHGDSRIINLPSGYYFGNGQYCNFHSRGQFVWSGMRSVNGSQPAVAVELDMDHNEPRATVGAGYLKEPVSAYFGNGFAP
jgi:hypothetical protein